MLFPLVTVASLRVSLTKDSKRTFTVLTQDMRTHESIEQGVQVEYDHAMGRPNPKDEEVLMGLIEISRQQGHATRELKFELDTLISLLQWHSWKWYKKRVETALRRWSVIKFTFEKGRYDETAGWLPHTLSVLSRLELDKSPYVVEWSELCRGESAWFQCAV